MWLLHSIVGGERQLRWGSVLDNRLPITISDP